MSDSSPGEIRPRSFTSEMVTAAILSIAALASAYASFQAELWDGEQASHYAIAEQSRTMAAKMETNALQVGTVDAIVFTQWLNAKATDQPVLEEFYRKGFRPAFKAQFDKWQALSNSGMKNPPLTPFEMPDYRTSAFDPAIKGERKADAEFQAGQDANDVGDRYGQSVLVLSISLFLGGIAQTFTHRRARTVLLILAAVVCVVGIGRLMMLPPIRLI